MFEQGLILLFACLSVSLHSETETPSPMKKDNSKEIFPIVDENGTVTGKATRGECHNGTKLLHPVVHLHILDSKGRLYLQLRPQWKEIQPGKWDTAVGGHVDYGEEIEAALLREAREEVGITVFTPQMLLKYVFESERERELVNVYSTIYNGEITPSEELDGGRFWTLDEIENAIEKEVLTPNFISEYQMIKPYLEQLIKNENEN